MFTTFAVSPLINTDYTISNTNNAGSSYYSIYKIDTTSVRTITLPSSPEQVMFYIIDGTGGASLNNITINGNGFNINGSSTLLINTSYGSVQIYYDTDLSKWLILN
jgi:hypothetical protein